MRTKMAMPLVRQMVTGPGIVTSITNSDVRQLATLMLESYRGTADDDGETLQDALQEIEDTFGGKYGVLLRRASFVARESPDSDIVSATIVTRFEELPLLAFSMTHSSYKRQGFARMLLQRCVNALLDENYTILRLVVTNANQPAVQLYRSMGFVEER